MEPASPPPVCSASRQHCSSLVPLGSAGSPKKYTLAEEPRNRRKFRSFPSRSAPHCLAGVTNPTLRPSPRRSVSSRLADATVGVRARRPPPPCRPLVAALAGDCLLGPRPSGDGRLGPWATWPCGGATPAGENTGEVDCCSLSLNNPPPPPLLGCCLLGNVPGAPTSSSSTCVCMTGGLRCGGGGAVLACFCCCLEGDRPSPL
mmetsp:Transcript_7627/g.21691  ORF Transcript_7627/g.21691 Transcript_7627/m.21691 type:complete len:203 (-) Transcript_7627:838-1446(-)